MQTSFLPLALALLIGLALGVLVGRLWAAARPERLQAASDDAVEHAEVVAGLDRLDAQLQQLAHQGVSWQSRLHQQVEDVRHSTDLLRRETGSLSTALRKPQVRGRWGEMHLRRAVELAGLVDRCDFDEQSRSVRSDGETDRTLIPDLVVRLAGGRCVLVDAKVPLDAFLDATAAEDPEEHAAHLARHARQLRAHAAALAGKGYWRGSEQTPEFVVLFVPGESFLSAALEAEPDLIDWAAQRQVVLATPTTLIALLRTVAMGWTHERLAEDTRQVWRLGRELHGRLSTMGEHLDKLGRSLKGSVDAYNRAVGSLESRVLVTARELAASGVTDEELPAPAALGEAPRPLVAPELLEAWPERAPTSAARPPGEEGRDDDFRRASERAAGTRAGDAAQHRRDSA